MKTAYLALHLFEMYMKRFLSPVLIVFALLFTTTTASLQAQPMVDSIIVCDITHDIPSDCKYLGELELTNHRKGCGYEKKVEQAKRKVMDAGGNILRITLVIRPTGYAGPCYNIWGEAYYTNNMTRTRRQMNIAEDTVSKKLISDTAKYALIYFYRRRPIHGANTAYYTYVNDKRMCAIADDTKCIVKMDKEGLVKISAFLEENEEKELDIQFGKVYFVKCQLDPGKRYVRPVLTFQHPNEGYYEYSAVSE